jgi:MtN3 and saliva related transmembrane protein
MQRDAGRYVGAAGGLRLALAQTGGRQLWGIAAYGFQILAGLAANHPPGQEGASLSAPEAALLSSATIELIGSLAAAITTLCWVPQALKVIRTRDTRALSLVMYLMLTLGIGLWLAYGLLIGSWPLIGANTVTFILVVIILGLKLRHG